MCAVAVVCASCTVQQSVYTTTRIPFQFLQKRIPKSRWAIQRAYASRKTSYAHSAHMIIIRSQSFFLCPFNTTAFEMGYLKFKWLLLVAGLDVSLLVCCCCCCCRCYSAVLLLSASWPFSLSLSLLHSSAVVGSAILFIRWDVFYLTSLSLHTIPFHHSFAKIIKKICEYENVITIYSSFLRWPDALSLLFSV